MNHRHENSITQKHLRTVCTLKKLSRSKISPFCFSLKYHHVERVNSSRGKYSHRDLYKLFEVFIVWVPLGSVTSSLHKCISPNIWGIYCPKWGWASHWRTKYVVAEGRSFPTNRIPKNRNKSSNGGSRAFGFRVDHLKSICWRKAVKSLAEK